MNITTMQKMKQWFFRQDFFSRRKQKIEIMVETKEVLQIRRLATEDKTFCPVCRAHTIFLSPEDAASLIRSDVRSIEILLAGGRVHFSDPPEKGLLICFDSLRTEIEKMPFEKIKKIEERK